MKDRSPSSSTLTKRSKARRQPRPPATAWTKDAVLRELQGARTTPALHALARRIGKNQELAEQLWSCGIHKAKTLATLVAEPQAFTATRMERWLRDFDSWDIVDGACCYVFALVPSAWTKIHAWSRRRGEFQKRAAFALAAYLSYKDRTAPDARFAKFLVVIEREAHDERHFVKKAVNWALRNIGKRNLHLNAAAIECAERIREQESAAARWIAADAIRELRSPAVQRRLRQKAS